MTRIPCASSQKRAECWKGETQKCSCDSMLSPASRCCPHARDAAPSSMERRLRRPYGSQLCRFEMQAAKHAFPVRLLSACWFPKGRTPKDRTKPFGIWLIEIAVLTILNTNPPGRLVAAQRRRGRGSGGADAQVTAHTSIRVAEVANPFIKDPPGRVVTARGGLCSRGGADAQAGAQAAALLTTRGPVGGTLPHRHRQRRLRTG